MAFEPHKVCCKVNKSTKSKNRTNSYVYATFQKWYNAMPMLLRAKHKILAKTYVVKKDEFSFMLNKCTEVGAIDFACCSVSRRSTERGVLDCLL
jgi:hypothetical protein